MMKRSLAFLVCFILLFSLITGCGNDVTSESTGTSTAAKTSAAASSTEASKPVTITVAYWDNAAKEQTNGLTALNEGLKKVRPNISVELVEQPVKDFETWMRMNIAANEAPDITLSQFAWAKEWFDQGVVENIKAEYDAPNPFDTGAATAWKDSFEKGRIEAAHNFLYEPSFAVPVSGLATGFFYNKDIYKQLSLNPPKTYNEFIENCKKIQAAGIQPVSIGLQQKDLNQWIFEYFVNTLAIDKFIANKEIDLNNDNNLTKGEAVRAVAKGLMKADDPAFKKVYTVMADFFKYCGGANAASMDEAAAKALFIQGKAAHQISGSWDVAYYKDNKDKKFEVGAFCWPKMDAGMSEYVGLPNMITSVSIYIPMKTGDVDKKKASVEYLQYLTSKDGYTLYANAANAIPVLKGFETKDTIYSDLSVKDGRYSQTFLIPTHGNAQKFNWLHMNTLLATGEKSIDEIAKLAAESQVNEVIPFYDTNQQYNESTNWKLDQDVNYNNVKK